MIRELAGFAGYIAVVPGAPSPALVFRQLSQPFQAKGGVS